MYLLGYKLIRLWHSMGVVGYQCCFLRIIRNVYSQILTQRISCNILFWTRKDQFAQNISQTRRYLSIYVLLLSRNERCLPIHFGKVMTDSHQTQRERLGGYGLDSSCSG